MHSKILSRLKNQVNKENTQILLVFKDNIFYTNHSWRDFLFYPPVHSAFYWHIKAAFLLENVCFVYRSRGCSEFVFLDNRLQHETLCRFRPVSCQNERHGCDAIFSVKVKRHLQRKTPSFRSINAIFLVKENFIFFGQGKTPSFWSR